MKLKMILASLMSLAAIGSCWAGAVSYDAAIDLQLSSWSNALTVPRFNPALGTLTSVKVTLTGTVQGSAKLESLDTEAQSITANVGASIDLLLPGGDTSVSSEPVALGTVELAAYDGTRDFDGPSGASVSGLSGSASQSVVLTEAGDLGLFTGADEIAFTITSGGASETTGSGNIAVSLASSSSAQVTVTYIYD